MTIIINLCWVDKIENWYDRNISEIKRYFLIFIMIASIPAFIVGILMFFDLIPSIYEGKQGMNLIDWTVTGGLMMYGLGGSVVFVIVITNTLQELNKEKHWFQIKHCEDKKDCD